MPKTTTHAGAVVFRGNDDQVRYLVVSSSDGANWVLPKGHIDAGESAEIAALRELAEEAGVIGEIVGRLSIQHLMKGATEGSVQYFLIRELGATPPAENRTIRWEDAEAALQLLTFDEARAALSEGAAVVSSLATESTDK
jgi:8-oxo-dGTP pyrophosphatase MutT (NUDIX family)